MNVDKLFDITHIGLLLLQNICKLNGHLCNRSSIYVCGIRFANVQQNLQMHTHICEYVLHKPANV